MALVSPRESTQSMPQARFHFLPASLAFLGASSRAFRRGQSTIAAARCAPLCTGIRNPNDFQRMKSGSLLPQSRSRSLLPD